MKKLHLNLPEIKIIINKCPMILNVDANNIQKIFEVIRKYGVTYEDAVAMLINRPTIFTHSVKDFDVLLQEVIEYEDCDIIEALNSYM